LYQRKIRTEKAASQIFKFLYYSIGTYYGYRVMMETPFEKKWFFGTIGDFNDFCITFPYYQSTPLVKNYVLITMGYHLGSCYPMLYTEKKNDMLEMSLHHFATLFCYFGLHLINVPGTICLCNYIHDLADITVSLSRLFSESKW